MESCVKVAGGVGWDIVFRWSLALSDIDGGLNRSWCLRLILSFGLIVCFVGWERVVIIGSSVQ